METTIVTREGFIVMGVQARINPMTADYQAIWQQQFMPHYEAIKAAASEDGCYDVYFATEEPDMADMVAGMRVATAPATVPEGLVARDVPGGEFVMASCGMDAIAATWKYLYETWLPQSTDYAMDPTRADYEYFAPSADPAAAQVAIFVPVRKI